MCIHLLVSALIYWFYRLFMWAQDSDDYTLSTMMKALHWWHNPQESLMVLPRGLCKTPVWHNKAFRMNPFSSFCPRGHQHLQANTRKLIDCVQLKETMKDTKWGMFNHCFLCIINKLLQWIFSKSGTRVLIRSWLCQKLSSSSYSRIQVMTSFLISLGNSDLPQSLFTLSF